MRTTGEITMEFFFQENIFKIQYVFNQSRIFNSVFSCYNFKIEQLMYLRVKNSRKITLIAFTDKSKINSISK